MAAGPECPEPLWLSVIPNVVTAVGTTMARTKQAAARDTAVSPAPRSLARRSSHAATQTAHRMNPGSTSGTRTRLAHGWSGAVCGSQSTITVVQAKIKSGSPQARAAPSASAHRRSARTQRRTSRAIPNPPRSSAGIPMYQMTQYRLSSAYERVGWTGRPSSFCSAPT